jgi:hypothetical protein
MYRFVSRSVLSFAVAVGIGAGAGCGLGANSDELVGQSASELQEEAQADKRSICHFPEEDPLNPHIVVVGPKAADAHLLNHPGDYEITDLTPVCVAPTGT